MSFKIFPFGQTPDGRRIPLIKDWETNASSDPNQHNQWCELFKDRLKGWALPTGEVNGLIALDIDVKNDGANGFKYLESLGVDIPQTAWQSTPSGGCHLFFKYDPTIQIGNSVNRKIGIDTRSTGGFVWLHKDTHFEIPLSPIPEWLPTIIKSQEPVSTVSEAPLKLDPALSLPKYYEAIKTVKEALQGERNATLNKAAYLVGKLIAGGIVTHGQAYLELEQAALAIGLDPYEVKATLKSGLGDGITQPLTHPFGTTPPTEVGTVIPPMPISQPKARWTPSYGTREMLTDWSHLKRPQIFKDWSSCDITLTSAIGGVGKTTLKLYEAVCLALGTAFLGFECITPGKTLFIIGEDTERKIYAMLGWMLKELNLLETHADTILNNIIIKRADDIPLVKYDRFLNNFTVNTDSVNKLTEAIEDLAPKQIIFDPIGMFAGPESGGNDAARAMMEVMQRLVAISGAAVDMISHIGKDSATKRDTSQFSARGATSLANHSRIVRTLLKLNAQEYLEETGEELADGVTAIKVFVSKFSDGSPLLDNPFIILRKGYLFSRKDLPKGNGSNHTADKTRIFNFIRDKSTDRSPMNEQAIIDHFFIDDNKISKSKTKAILSVLQTESAIEIVEHPDVTLGDWVRIKT